MRDAIYNHSNAALDIDKLPEDFHQFAKGLIYFVSCVSEARTFAMELSRGVLDVKPPSQENEMAAPLKSLHATLRHLTWQSREVAAGDYNQRVDFMGDFADSFNKMIVQLESRRRDLIKEIEKSAKKNRALENSASLLEAITGQISQWIIVVNRKNAEWLFTNRDIYKVLADISAESELRDWLKKYIAHAPNDGSQSIVDVEFKNGDLKQYFSTAVHPLQWHVHDALAFVFTDITSEKARLNTLETAAYRDTLTNVFNRHYGMELLNKLVDTKQIFIICFIDMDNLKYVNDKYGHVEGDKYILLVAGILRDFSPDTAVCRLGGDEFMLLAYDWNMFDAERRLEELRSRLIGFNDSPGAFYSHSMSYGVVEVGIDNKKQASDLLALADEKMYLYKRTHRAERQSRLL